MACFKNLMKSCNCVLLRNTFTLPYSPVINSLHLCTTDITVLFMKNSHINHGAVRRTLYTDAGLGIEKFKMERNLTRQHYLADAAESFRSKMQEMLDRSNKMHTLVFKQDLERAIYLSDNQEDHLELVKEMAIKYSGQNSNLRFGSFKFGPIIIRLFYVLDRPDLAMEMVANPELSPLFGSTVCYQLLMSLMYRHKLYSEVLDMMDQLSTGRLLSQRYPRSCVMLALASALRMNNEEGLTRGLALAETALSACNMPRRFSALAGTIALQADRPDTAVKMLRDTKWPSYYTIRNILVLAWCELGRLDQVLALLRPLAHEDSGGMHTERTTIFTSTYDKVKEAVQLSADPALAQEFVRIERALMDRKLVDNMDLVECVLQPLEMSETVPRYSRQEAAYYTGSLMRHERDSARGRRRESLLDDSG